MKGVNLVLFLAGICVGFGFGILIGMTITEPTSTLPSPQRTSGAETAPGRPDEHLKPLPSVGESNHAPSDTESLRKLSAQMRTLEEENRVLNERNRDLTLELNKLHQEIARRNAEQRSAPLATHGTVTNLAGGTRTWRQAFELSRGLTKQLADEIGLSEEQLSSANAAIQRTNEKVRTLELANAEIRPVSDTELVIKVKPFPKEASETRESLLNELRQILSPEQFRQLEEKIGSFLNSPLSGFGEAYRDIIIKTETAADGRGKRYRITESSRSQQEASAGDTAAVVTMGFGGSAGASSSSEAISIQSLSTESGSGGQVTRMKTMYVSEIPPEYRHFLPSETN